MILRTAIGPGRRAPSGTEPKLKAYLEVVEPVAGRVMSPRPASAPRPALAALRTETAAALGSIVTAESAKRGMPPNWRSPASPSPGTMNARSLSLSSMAAVTSRIGRPEASSRAMPSGAARTQITVMSVQPRSAMQPDAVLQ